MLILNNQVQTAEQIPELKSDIIYTVLAYVNTWESKTKAAISD